MANIKTLAKEKFDWDVSALPEYTKETMPEFVTDLIGNSKFLASLTPREGIKGRERINLLNGDVQLQAKTGCTQSPDGAFIFTDETLEVVPLYMGIEFCNEDFVGKVTEIMLSMGMRTQNGQLPADLDQIVMAYLAKKLARKLQRTIILGDESSTDDELVLFNGIRYRINNNTDVVDYMSTQAAITASNAYAIAYGLFKSIPAELFDNEMEVTIYTGRDTALLILEDWNQANPYNQVPLPTDVSSSMEFILPLTNVKVMSLPELNGKPEMYAWTNSLVFVGTDSKDDWSFQIKYDEYNDKLKAEAKFRAGTQIVWGQYFTRLQLAVS